jgi:hypothetical protein
MGNRRKGRLLARLARRHFHLPRVAGLRLMRTLTALNSLASAFEFHSVGRWFVSLPPLYLLMVGNARRHSSPFLRYDGAAFSSILCGLKIQMHHMQC